MARKTDIVAVALVLLAASFAAADDEPSAESRALAFLAREVPAWSKQEKCYSCHNNGDAARALHTASRLKLPVPALALADTNRWLAEPERWDKNGGDGPFNDRKLARIQFAAALVEGLAAGQITGRKPLARAAELVAELQDADGSWSVGAEGGGLGHPATYGPFLATWLARRTLQEADPKRYGQAITKAEAWLTQAKVKSTMDAAAVLLALEGIGTEAAAMQRRHCLELIGKGQARDGGWGPYATSPPEPFDTAMALLALARQEPTESVRKQVDRGRAYLAASQEKDGSWPPTTRPPGADSYAQRLSTTGWATLALLATRK